MKQIPEMERGDEIAKILRPMMFYLFTYLFVTINDNKLMNTEMPYGWSEITYIMII